MRGVIRVVDGIDVLYSSYRDLFVIRVLLNLGDFAVVWTQEISEDGDILDIGRLSFYHDGDSMVRAIKWIEEHGHDWFTAEDVALGSVVSLDTATRVLSSYAREGRFDIRAKTVKGRRDVIMYKFYDGRKIWRGRIRDAVHNPLLIGKKWRVV